MSLSLQPTAQPKMSTHFARDDASLAKRTVGMSSEPVPEERALNGKEHR